MPPDMYGHAYIRVYSYVLLSILKFAQQSPFCMSQYTMLFWGAVTKISLNLQIFSPYLCCNVIKQLLNTV